MSIGMSYKEFWEEDVELTKIYLKAYKMKEKRKFQNIKWQMWEQGLYIYEALCDVSPILRAFSKAKKPLPYPEKPYGIDEYEENTENKNKNKKKKEQKNKEKQEELELYKAQVFFTNWAKATQNHFRNEKGGINNNGGSNTG